MRIMSMHKATPDMEAGVPPSAKVMAAMGPFMGELAQTGMFVAGEGLRPSAHGVRLRFRNGRRTITKGPLTGSNELLSAYAIVSTKTIDEAIEWASRTAAADAEIDVRPVTEPWDFGMMPRPENANTRYMVIYKADAQSESGVRRPDVAGDIVLTAGALQPSARGLRLRFRDGKRTVIDGPFTESKELIAGFSILEVPSIDDAVAIGTRFAAIIGDIEIDIRPMY